MGTYDGSATSGTTTLPVGVVQRGRERVGVGGEGDRSGGPERAHDVDALTRAREEDDRHGRREYPRLWSDRHAFGTEITVRSGQWEGQTL